MNKKYLALFVSLFFAGSCASTQTLRRNYIMSHPNLPENQKAAILNGNIVIGMDINTVIAVLGNPYKAVNKETARKDIQILNFKDWENGRGHFIKVTLVNNTVTEIVRAYQEPNPRPARRVIIVR